MNRPELIVMLTHNDVTVSDAAKVFEECRHSKAQFWGFKEIGLPTEEMKALFSYMKSLGKTTGLEVVVYTEEEGLAGAQLAAACHCDILMGTLFSEKILAYCQEHNLKYMPFVGTVTGRPSVLSGTIEGMIREANSYLEKGVYGIDLLGYRYVGDPVELNRRFVSAVNGPVCLAGSVNSYQRLDEIREANPWSFTIGGAFFENRFGGSIPEQIDKVIDYVNR